jgi:DNA-binding XRE family transcriptional regulator
LHGAQVPSLPARSLEFCLWVYKRQLGWLRQGLRQVFAANLRGFRHAKGLSQEGLAYEAGVNRTYMSKLERAGRSWAWK